jgi:hypothetical protein
MPPKGWTAGREETEVKAVRLPKSLIERIAQHVERLQGQFRFGRINEGMAIRDLLEVGLDTVEGHAPQPQPAQVPLTTQPALPLALEGVPASQVQSLAPTPQPARKSKTPSSRRKDGKGGNPGLSPETLQQIADTAAQYDKLSFAELSRLLFDRGIHRATDSTTGEEKPVNPGTLKKQLDRAREQGLL